jgi:hypothetical protein
MQLANFKAPTIMPPTAEFGSSKKKSLADSSGTQGFVNNASTRFWMTQIRATV